MTKLFKVTYCNPEMIKYWLDQYFAVFVKPDPEELSKNIKKYGKLIKEIDEDCEISIKLEKLTIQTIRDTQSYQNFLETGCYEENDETKICDFNDFNMLEARLVFSTKEIYIKVLDKDFGDKIMWGTKAYKHEDFQKN